MNNATVHLMIGGSDGLCRLKTMMSWVMTNP
jgi:hypothetical protein